MNRLITAHTAPRNAPNTTHRISGIVDALTVQAEDAAAIGLHAAATDLFRARDIVAGTALALLRREVAE